DIPRCAGTLPLPHPGSLRSSVMARALSALRAVELVPRHARSRGKSGASLVDRSESRAGQGKPGRNVRSRGICTRLQTVPVISRDMRSCQAFRVRDNSLLEIRTANFQVARPQSFPRVAGTTPARLWKLGLLFQRS